MEVEMLHVLILRANVVDSLLMHLNHSLIQTHGEYLKLNRN